jgi:hypothetical protein
VYEQDLGTSSLGRLLRYACFPFALGAAEPSHVRGLVWLPAALGATAVVGLAFRRDRRATSVAGLAIVASLLPVVGVRYVQPHYTYASTWAWAFLIALAFERRGTGRAPVWRTVGFCLMVALLAWHARRSAEQFELSGRTMANLEAEYAGLPNGEVTVAGESAVAHTAALRFAAHVRHCKRSPTLRVVQGSGEAAALIVAADGAVRRQ